MPDQTLMEILMEGFDDETKKEYKDCEGMYLDVCEWSCVKCDDDQKVIEIDIESSNITGSLELCYVPPNVNVVKIRSWGEGKMSGSVDLARLPDGITEILLYNNGFTGEIDLTHLPGGMTELSLYDNQLTGEIDLTQLPKGMKYLFLKNNQLSGSVVIRRLPQGMKMIDLRENHFNAFAVVDSKATDVDIFLSGSGVTSIVDENGKEVDVKRFPN